jgi:hypothetical protein
MEKSDIQKIVDKYPTPYLKSYQIRELEMNGMKNWTVFMLFNGKFPQGRSFEAELKEESDLHNFELKIREVLRLY